MLEVKNAVFGYKGKNKTKEVVRNISFDIRPGELLCVLGANGAGKTTMYRTILRFLPLLKGQLLLEGKNMESMPREEISKGIAYVPQYHTPPFAYSVHDVVLMGRGTHVSRFSSPGKEDEKIADMMLERMGLFSLRNEIYTEISGGERQLVLIARALAQQTKYILMDEPAANLDFGNQMRLLGEIKKLTNEGIGVCFTTHNPDHAFMTDASVLALEGEDRWTVGPAEEVITEKLLGSIYSIDARIHTYEGKKKRIMRQVSAELE